MAAGHGTIGGSAKKHCVTLMVRQRLPEEAQLDNIARTVFANNNADYHIALHYDSSTTDKGAFYISVPDVASYRRMYPVSENWIILKKVQM